MHIAVFFNVAFYKRLVARYCQAVQQMPFGKIEIEIWLIEIENTVVINQVDVQFGIKNADGTVPKSRVQLALVRATSHNSDFSFVRQPNLSKRQCVDQQQYEKQDFFHGCEDKPTVQFCIIKLSKCYKSSP